MNQLDTNVLSSGFFIRGVLQGYAQLTDRWTDRQGQAQTRQVHVLGIQCEYIDKYMNQAFIVRDVVIPEDLMRDQEFKRDITQYRGKFIEIELSGLVDYNKRHLLSKNAIINPMSDTVPYMETKPKTVSASTSPMNS